MTETTAVVPHDATSQIDMLSNEALTRQYSGLPIDPEARRTQAARFRIDAGVADIVDRIVQDPLTEYQHMSDFYRHAAFELLWAWDKGGYKCEGLSEIISFENAIHMRADRAGRRSELRVSLHKFDEEINIARKQRDWEYLIGHMVWVEELLADAPGQSARAEIQANIADSKAMQLAVKALLTWPGMEEDVKMRAEKWRGMMEDWSA